MSLSVKIIDNDNGRVLIDEPESVAVAGVVAVRGDEHVPQKVHGTRVGNFSYFRCDPVTIYHCLEGLQRTIITIQQRNPNIEKMGELLDLFSKMEKIGETENDGN